MKINFDPVDLLVSAICSLIGLVLTACITGVIVMLLWNWLVPGLLPCAEIAHSINWYQGWGIAFLCGILFK